jgi:hypothetical protein
MSDGSVRRFFWRVVDALDYVARTTAAIAFFFFITIGACKADNSVLDLNDAASSRVLQQMSSKGKGNKILCRDEGGDFAGSDGYFGDEGMKR